MLNIDHPEVAAAQVAGTYALDYNDHYNNRRIEVVSNPIYQGTDNLAFGDVYFVPVHVHGPGSKLRAGDLIVSIRNGKAMGCSLR